MKVTVLVGLAVEDAVWVAVMKGTVLVGVTVKEGVDVLVHVVVEVSNCVFVGVEEGVNVNKSVNGDEGEAGVWTELEQPNPFRQKVPRARALNAKNNIRLVIG